MPLGTSHETSTTLDVYLPEIWSAKVNEFYRAGLVTANFFTDMSSEVASGGDVIHIPATTEMTANTKTNGSEVTLNNPTDVKVDLSIDTWKEVSFLIEDKEAVQVMRSYNLQERYARNAGYTAAKALEDAIMVLFSTFTTNSVGASTTNLADSEIRSAIRKLDEGNVPFEDRAFFLHPKVFWSDVQGIDKFALAINTKGADPILKRPDAYLYGIPVYVTPRVPYVSGTTGRTNFLGHKDCIVWAAASLRGGSSNGPVRLQASYIQEYLGTLVTADIVYGVKLNRQAGGCRVLTSA